MDHKLVPKTNNHLASLTCMLPACRHLALLWMLCGSDILALHAQPVESGPQLLEMSEVRELAGPAPAPPETLSKLKELLNTPFVSNTTAPPDGSLPPELSVVFWNIERGIKWELISAALTDTAAYRKLVETKKPIAEDRWQKAMADLAELKRADIIILNEVDLGMKRTRYADVTRQLAKAAGMNFAFGVEFLEVDRLYLGDERIELETPELSKALADDLLVDPERYRGLHGNAILSRFPIRSASISRLSDCYDWYEGEISSIAGLEKGKRWAAKKVFSERIIRQVRRGGRMALTVELDVKGGSPGLTVVSTHLEDRSQASCRARQMNEVLGQLIDVSGPVILGGDLNTTARDGTPTSVGHEIKKRVADPSFWVQGGLRWFTPVAIPSLLTLPVNLWKNHHDPTAIHIPLLGPNRARRMFDDLRAFRFADGGQFDFSGDHTRSGNGRGRTLGNSNDRAWKGFHPTYRMERTYFIAGTYRLDWLLVKRGPETQRFGSLRPRNPKTLRHLNQLGDEHMSDHHPIVVEIESSTPAVSTVNGQ